MKDFVKSYLGHMGGYVMGAATIVSSLDGKLLPPQYSFFISLAGMIVTAGHHGYTAGNASGIVTAAAKAALDAASKVAAVAPALLLAVVLGAGMLTGCATMTPTQKAQANAGATVAVQVAAGFAIQQKSNDPAAWKARAVEFKAIAIELQTVNNAGTATLATLAADLAPLVTKLPPADQLAAQAAVAGLTPFLQAQIQANPSAGAVQAEVATVLSAFIAACEAYGA
jgi:hypothetical protein